jgi:hypothetical protein
MRTIQIPQDLEQQLIQLATQQNLPLETFILESLQQLAQQEPDPHETPNDRILESLHQGFKEAFTGQTVPLAQMWDGIDAE